MVKDSKTGMCHRADKLIGEVIEKLLTKKNIKPEMKERLEKILNDVEQMSPS
jgi:glycyl-tRNA synthetase